MVKVLWDKPRCEKRGGLCLKEGHTAWKTWARISVFYTEPVAKDKGATENIKGLEITL